MARGLEVSFHSNTKEEQGQRMFNYHTIVLISHASKFVLKFFKLVFSSGRTNNFQMHKLGLEKAEEHPLDHRKSKGIPEKKTSTSASLITKMLRVDDNKLRKILKKMRISDCLTCLLRNLYASQEATLRTNTEQQIGSKLGKE